MVNAIVFLGSVCGTEKTTFGVGVAAHLGCPFLEGDSFHPPENVEKMCAGLIGTIAILSTPASPHLRPRHSLHLA